MNRHYVPSDFKVTTWELLKPFYDELLKRELSNEDKLERWLRDGSELGSVVSEDMAWRYIKMTCDTNNEELRNSFNDFVTNIEPNIAPIANELNKKLIDCKFAKDLPKDRYFVYIRGVEKAISLFREQNIPLKTELQQKEQEFGAINGKQTITYNGEEMTLQKAGVYLKNLDRRIREEVYNKVAERRSEDEKVLNDLYTELIELRDKIAKNTGFENYRDYKHEDLGRFDYSVQDCLNFHEAVKQHAVPLIREHDRERKTKLGLEDYRPWDTAVDTEGKEPLKPFSNAKELTEKTITCFNKIDPYFGECIKTMDDMKRLDLESRIGKAPGGYQYPLYETDVPFIFMNSVGLHRDLVTMVHEGGHAIHSFLCKDLELMDFKSPPSEIAELASMSMELISMEHWHVFFENKEDLKRAKRQQLESVMDTLPWIAAIDKFQHWVYLNPKHSVKDRYDEWTNIMNDFGSDVINYKGFENNLKRRWQVQLHLFEVPFYYIEYGIAQLGAIGLWKQFKEDKNKAINNYINALKLGGTKTLPELYKAAGLKFSFAPGYISELMLFVQKEMEKITHPKII
jgi:oligoendopeptidase F